MEFLIFLVGFIVGGVIGGLVYRNNADEWQEHAQELEDQFDQLVEDSGETIDKLTREVAELKNKLKK